MVGHAHRKCARLVSLRAQRAAWLGAGPPAQPYVAPAVGMSGVARPNVGRNDERGSRSEPRTYGMLFAPFTIINALQDLAHTDGKRPEPRFDIDIHLALALIRNRPLALRHGFGAIW